MAGVAWHDLVVKDASLQLATKHGHQGKSCRLRFNRGRDAHCVDRRPSLRSLLIAVRVISRVVQDGDADPAVRIHCRHCQRSL